MRKLLEIFALEIKSLTRSWTAALLTAASVVWMFLFPHLVRGDGTPDGARELYLHFSLGGVFALLVVALLASATGSLARERAARRLQLTMVRPVRHSLIVLGKILAHVAVGAAVLGVACAVLAFKVDLMRPCSHVLSPILQSPQEEAKAMYEEYMKDPATPPAIKRARKDAVIRLLTNRAIDHYQVVETNSTASWRFGRLNDDHLAVRMRFSNQLEMRQDVRGQFRLGECRGTVSNITQAVVTVPLTKGVAAEELTFDNWGAGSLMLRPRKDLNLLVRADAFWRNLIRVYVVLVAILAFVISVGLFLSAGLGRPVALFVAFTLLIVSEMSPSVVEQYPDELETNAIDRIGLAIARFAADVTRPVSAASPLEAMSKDECVESSDVMRMVLTDMVAVPLALALLAAFVLPFKQEDLE